MQYGDAQPITYAASRITALTLIPASLLAAVASHNPGIAVEIQMEAQKFFLNILQIHMPAESIGKSPAVEPGSGNTAGKGYIMKRYPFGEAPAVYDTLSRLPGPPGFGIGAVVHKQQIIPVNDAVVVRIERQYHMRLFFGGIDSGLLQ